MPDATFLLNFGEQWTTPFLFPASRSYLFMAFYVYGDVTHCALIRSFAQVLVCDLSRENCVCRYIWSRPTCKWPSQGSKNWNTKLPQLDKPGGAGCAISNQLEGKVEAMEEIRPTEYHMMHYHRAVQGAAILVSCLHLLKLWIVLW